MSEVDFEKRWKLRLSLPAVLHGYVDGKILPWSKVSGAIDGLDRTLKALPEKLIERAKIGAVLLVDDLMVLGQPADGACSDFDPSRLKGSRPLIPNRLTWIALNRSLFDAPADELYLRVPLLDARACEEVAHAWDTELEYRASRLCSVPGLPGSAWKPLASVPGKKPAEFPVPNRKDYNLNEEDWALAVVWYIFHKIALHNMSRPHHDFVELLFQQGGITSC
jgi:hypothetical protein